MTWHKYHQISNITRVPAGKGSSVLVVSRWLWLGNRTFLPVASMMVTYWIVSVFAVIGNVVLHRHNELIGLAYEAAYYTGINNDLVTHCLCSNINEWMKWHNNEVMLRAWMNIMNLDGELWLFELTLNYMHCAKKYTVHEVTTILVTSKNALFLGHNNLLTTGTDDPSF